MTYSPKFQEVLDKCEAMSQAGNSTSEIKEFFFNTVKDLGPYERLNNMYRIRPKRPVLGEPSRVQFFRMNKMQDYYYTRKTNRDLILKMRQGGVTTLSCLIALDKCLWENGVHTAIMAHVRENVKKIFRITKNALTWFQRDWSELYPVSCGIDNINELRIVETGSELLVCTETKGLTLDFLHISEATFVDDARISESLESVPFSGQIILESTPNTASGLFYDLWEEGNKLGKVTFTPHFFPWWITYPEDEDKEFLVADEKFKLTDSEMALTKAHELDTKHIIWRRIKIAENGGDIGEFARKYPEDPMTCFLSGSSGVFPMGVLAALWKMERAPAFTGELTLEGKI